MVEPLATIRVVPSSMAVAAAGTWVVDISFVAVVSSGFVKTDLACMAARLMVVASACCFIRIAASKQLVPCLD